MDALFPLITLWGCEEPLGGCGEPQHRVAGQLEVWHHGERPVEERATGITVNTGFLHLESSQRPALAYSSLSSSYLQEFLMGTVKL